MGERTVSTHNSPEMRNRPGTQSSPVTPNSAGTSPGARSDVGQTRTPRNRGVGMLIITAYGIFAISSFARALYQLLTDFGTSPLAYLLSAFAAAVYIVATLALARADTTAWTVALVAVLIEMVGVLGVGLWTLLDPELFNRATVWSEFGAGYGYIPLILPFVGLFWLLKHRPRSQA